MGSANKHGDVPGRSRPCLDHRDRPLALVQPGIHAASSEAGARRHRRYSHASTDSFPAAKGPAFLQNFQLRGASIFRYPLVPSIWRTSISPQVHVMSHHWIHTATSSSRLRVAGEVGITAGWGETEVLMDVSSWRLAPVQHRHLPARGLLSLFSLLRAFLLTAIKHNQPTSEETLLPRGF